MDRVRFGKAIGTGTRHAARALLEAAEAASTPAPAAHLKPASTPRPTSTPTPTTTNPSQRTPRHAAAAVKQGSKRFGEAVWGPFVKLSGVLWLEVTGVFFGVFALTAGVEVWKRRAALHTAGDAHTHLLFALGMCLVFTWFTLSSFLRAARRGRR
jgi:hypothetical protein